MDDFNVLEIFDAESEKLLEKYVEKLCKEIIRLNKESGNFMEDVLNKNLTCLCSWMACNGGTFSINKFNENTINILKEVFTSILSSYLTMESGNSEIARQFLVLFSTSTSNIGGNETLLETFIAYIEAQKNEKDFSVNGLELAYMHRNMYLLLENYISIGNMETVVVLFSKLAKILFTSPSIERFNEFVPLFKKTSMRFVTSLKDYELQINESFTCTWQYFCIICEHAVKSLTETSRFNLQDQQLIDQEVTLSITVLHIILEFVAAIQPHKFDFRIIDSVINHYATWCVIQMGVCHCLATTRKMTVVVLQLLVNHLVLGSTDLSVCWPEENSASQSNSSVQYFDNKERLLNWSASTLDESAFAAKLFIQICEMLEESQIHVIKPVVNKIHNLFANHQEDQQFISSSWIFSILRRMFSHESKLVQKEGVRFCFETNFKFSVMKQRSCFSFLCGGLLNILRDDQIYFQASSKNPQCQDDADLHQSLKNFMIKCHQESFQAAIFMKNFLYAMSLVTWSPVSLLYVCDAFNSMPCTLAWDDQHIFTLRDLMTRSVRTHNVVLRKTTQRILLSSLVKYCNSVNLNAINVLKVIVVCVKNKSLLRGSKLWEKVAAWFVKEFGHMKSPYNKHKPTNIAQFTIEFVDKLLSDSSAHHHSIMDSHSADCVALCFCLVIDGLVLEEDVKQSKEVVHSVMSLVSGITDNAATHIYMSQLRVDSAFAFINGFILICNNSCSNSDVIQECLLAPILRTYDGVLEYIGRKIPGSGSDFNMVELYLNTVENLLVFLLGQASPQQKIKFLVRLSTTVSTVLLSSSTAYDKLSKLDKRNNETVQRILISVLSMYWCCKLTRDNKLTLNQSALYKMSEYLNNLDLEGSKLKKPDADVKEEWSKIFVKYLQFQWLCVPHIMFDKNKVDDCDIEKYISLLTDQLDVFPGDDLICLFKAAQALLSHTTSDNAAVANMIESMWKTTCDLIHSSSFRALYKYFVAALFQPCVLSASRDTTVCSTIKNVLCEIASESKSKPGLLHGVIKSCKEYWLSSDNSNAQSNEETNFEFVLRIFSSQNNLRITESIQSMPILSVQQHASFIIHCLSYCQPLTKDSKSIQQAVLYAQNMEGYLAPQKYYDKDGNTCLLATSILLKLNILNPEQAAFGNYMLHQLIEYDIMLTQQKPRYHLASVTHYTKQKIWQNIIILLPFITNEDSKFVVDSIISRLSSDLQASVRHLCEWTLALLISRFKHYEKFVIEKLETNVIKGSSFSSICSYLSVLLLYGVCQKHERTIQEEKQFFLKLVNIAIPWCMTQHFSIRLYAHAILLRVFQYFKDTDDEDRLVRAYPSLKMCLEFADNSSGNVAKNWHRIKEHFMLFKADPLADYSLETIFITIPNLCHLDAPTFDDVIETFTKTAWLPISNQRSILRNLQPSVWMASSKKKLIESHDDDLNVYDVKEVNIQKKIVVFNHERKTPQPGLILVASLIQKPSNLGGLTRTCEVFGAERIVVHSLSCTDDKLYQSLSVTAHKWIKLEEVKRWNLQQYLVDMRAKGYTLIGTEQTEKSHCLSSFKFPKKCVLVLGNEKEGIPASILSKLDDCIEIPQVGIIRSLNVHVSGALAVWEYRRQYMDGCKH